MAKALPVEDVKRLRRVTFEWLRRNGFEEEMERPLGRVAAALAASRRQRRGRWPMTRAPRARLPGGAARVAIRGTAPRHPVAAVVFDGMRTAHFTLLVADETFKQKERKQEEARKRVKGGLGTIREFVRQTVPATDGLHERLDLAARSLMNVLDEVKARRRTGLQGKVPRSAKPWDSFRSQLSGRLTAAGMDRQEAATLVYGEEGTRFQRAERVRKSGQRAKAGATTAG